MKHDSFYPVKHITPECCLVSQLAAGGHSPATAGIKKKSRNQYDEFSVPCCVFLVLDLGHEKGGITLRALTDKHQ